MSEIAGFYRNYDSMRYVGDQLVIRLRSVPADDELALLNERFGHLCLRGSIERASALPAELREQDAVTLPRIVFAFAKHGFGDLRRLIDTLNTFTAT